MKGFALTKLGRLDEAERTLQRCEQGANADRTDREFWRQYTFALAASPYGAAMVARIRGQWRARGELPSYLKQPLDELQRLLRQPVG